MRINTNVAALTASRNAFVADRDQQAAMAKLSSGLRITRAADDAAGLALANNLRTNARQLSVAASNATQANAVLSIAEGALQQVKLIYDRKAELASQQSSTGTIGSQTATIATELTTLDAEVTRILNSATYQGQGIFGRSLSFTVGTASGSDTITVDLSSYSAAGVNATNINDVMVAVGVGQSRLDYTIANLKTAIVNTKAAESVIRDADMAEEMSKFTSAQVLAQAGTAMLAQANSSSQQVLQILRG